MVAWLTLEKRRSSCGGELPGDRPSADWEQRHRCSLLVLASPVLLTAGVLTEEGGKMDDAGGELSRGQHWRAAAAIAAAAAAASSSQ